MRRLRQILGYPAVFLGSSPYIAPSMYHLMSHLDLEGGVLYPMGGFTRLIESIADLARAEGVTIISEATVTAISTLDGVATGAEYTNAKGVVTQVAADIVVSAADLHHTETALLPADLQTFPQSYWDTRVPGPSALLLYLGVQGQLPRTGTSHPVLRPGLEERVRQDLRLAHRYTRSGISLRVQAERGWDQEVAPEGFENIFVLVPIPADPSLGHGSDLTAVADRVIDQIGEWAGIPDFASRITLRREVGPADFVDDLNAWAWNRSRAGAHPQAERDVPLG